MEDAIADLHTPAKPKQSDQTALVAALGLVGALACGGFLYLFLHQNSSPFFSPVATHSPTSSTSPPPIPISPVPRSPSPIIPIPAPATSVELKALEHLILIANTSGKYYQAHGQFLTELSLNPSLDKYTLQITSLGNHGLQVSGTPTTGKLRSFIVLAWGGPYPTANLPTTPTKTQPSKSPLDDLGLFHLPNQLPNVKVSPHIVVTNYCESVQPSQTLPPKADLPIQQPKTYKDWSCPEGYTFAFTATKIMGKLAATQSPSVLFQLPPLD